MGFGLWEAFAVFAIIVGATRIIRGIRRGGFLEESSRLRKPILLSSGVLLLLIGIKIFTTRAEAIEEMMSFGFITLAIVEGILFFFNRVARS